MEITVNYSNLGLYDESIEKLVKKVLQKGAEIQHIQDSAEISILLCGNGEIHQLNRQYRGVDAPTDVLSFALNEGAEDPAEEESALGDIVISLDRLRNRLLNTDTAENGRSPIWQYMDFCIFWVMIISRKKKKKKCGRRKKKYLGPAVS